MIDVQQGVVVLDVSEDGDHVHVDVYGGAQNVCGTIRFRFPDERDRVRKVASLRRWQQSGTLLTLVANGSTITLQDDVETFGRQLRSG